MARRRPVREWWRGTRLFRWMQRNRADRQMPAAVTTWAPGGPVTVWLHPSLPGSYSAQVFAECAWWNRVIGREALAPRWMDEEAERLYTIGFWSRGAVVLIGAPERPVDEHGATTSHDVREDGTAIRAEVRLQHGLKHLRLCRVVRHELGHVLGLGDNHGGDDALLMNPRGDGFEVLDDERKWLRRQWPATDWE